MKKAYSIIMILLISSFVFAQDINQFDAEGKRHGIWKKNFEDTNILRYEGEFNHGKEIGLFKFYINYKNQAVLSATKLFNDTDSTADVKFLASNGSVISEGQMNGKNYIGTWKYYQQNSKNLLSTETYNSNGELIGERLVYYPSGQIAEKQNYSDGKLEGPAYSYSVKNVILKQYFYVNGELHGEAKFYNPEGVLLSEGVYKRGQKEGVWKFYENGKLVNEKNFSYRPQSKKKLLKK
ncbi:toxin-antitoxin system YwqK family antitoxin [Tamlana sp. I1]|uniref:toxin-antitoxin system YwqK family antitoxin n=1 Tax=Tamlana sp. I1 TaxID=2762061 RepID=UPI00189018C2|nr:toxin-antitoxin system YwqK family antitoxin [Tamlana sp. I1]